MNKSILSKLSKESIFSLTPNRDSTFCIQESCDYYYEANLTKSDLLKLASEIIEMAQSNG